MEPEKKSNGALIGLVVIIIILIIGGIYIWQSNKDNEKKVQDSQATLTEQDATALDTLESDLNATDTNTGVDANTIN